MSTSQALLEACEVTLLDLVDRAIDLGMIDMPPGRCTVLGVYATVDGASRSRLLPWML